MQPYNYSMNVPNPAGNVMTGVMQGVQLASGIENFKNQQVMKQYNSELSGLYGQDVDKQAFAQQMIEKYPQFAQNTMKAMTVLDQQEQTKLMQGDLATLAANKNATAEDYSKMILKYPQLGDQFKQSYDMLNQGKKDSALKSATNLYSAISSGNIDVAKQLLQTKITAAENANLPDEATTAKLLLQQLNISPEAAKTTAGLFLSYADPDSFKKYQESLKTQTEANIASTYAEREMSLKEENLALDKQKNQLRALELQKDKEGNAIEREKLQLQVDELKLKINEKNTKLQTQKRDLEAEGSGAIADVDRGITLLTDIIEHPSFETAVGISGPLTTWVPGTGAYDVKKMLETAESQTFMTEIQKMKGLGALSENEGKKASAAATSLDNWQSEKQLKKNINLLVDTLKTAKSRLEKKYQKTPTKTEIPQTSGDQVLDDLMKKYLK